MNGRLSLFATLIALAAVPGGVASASPFTRPALVSSAAQQRRPDKLGRNPKKRDQGRLLLDLAARDKAPSKK